MKPSNQWICLSKFTRPIAHSQTAKQLGLQKDQHLKELIQRTKAWLWKPNLGVQDWGELYGSNYGIVTPISWTKPNTSSKVKQDAARQGPPGITTKPMHLYAIQNFLMKK